METTPIHHNDDGGRRLLVGEGPLRDRFQRRSGAELGKGVDHFETSQLVIDFSDDTRIEK